MSPSPLIPGGPVVELFGSGGGAESARRLSLLTGFEVPLLAQIPFDPRLGSGGDSGKPIVLGDPGKDIPVVWGGNSLSHSRVGEFI